MSEDKDSPRGQPQPIVDIDFLRDLITAVDESGIDSLDVSRGGTRIKISKTPPRGPEAAASPPIASTVQTAPAAAAPATAPEPAPAEVESNLVDVKSPMVGTFYRSPAPEAPSYVEVGSHVSKGQTLCILEAMKLMNELESEVDGVVREVCVENNEPIEYGQILFRIEPEA